MVVGQSGASVAGHVAEVLKEELVQIQRHKMGDNTAKEIPWKSVIRKHVVSI